MPMVALGMGYGPHTLGMFGKYWLDKGGVYALANIRGGNELGPHWHQSALKKNRSNSYNDFIAISEDLIRRKITSPQLLAIKGASNGGNYSLELRPLNVPIYTKQLSLPTHYLI